MNYTVYDSNTGEIQHVFTSQDPDLTQQNLQGLAYIPGHYNSKDHYVVDQQVVEKPTVPTVPGHVYKFDYVQRTWQLDIGKTQTASRQLRNNLLAAVDRINPVWYNSLTSEQQTELNQYRQALLDVPQQTGWPESVTWPSQPTWL